MHEELEAELRRKPDDREAWVVYGDWLLEHGDKRGELVRSHRQPTDEERARWRGPIAERYVRWRHGFVIELELPLSARGVQVLGPLLADRASRLLSSLVLRPLVYEDDNHLLAEQTDQSIDPLDSVLVQDLRRLRALAIRYVELTDRRIDALARASLAITTLDLRYTGLTDERLERLLAAPWFANVRRLHLQGTAITNTHAERLVAHGLDFLDLRDSGLTAAAIDDRIPHLGAYGSQAYPRQAAPRAPGVPVKLVEGLSLSPQRTARFTSPRVVDKRPLSRTFTKDCERVAGMRDFIVVYVDPDEWTFRTYENILPLDRLITNTQLSLDDHRELAHEIHRFTLRGELPAFDDLPLYAKPLNAGTRGGSRYIFHAAPLAEALTRAIRTALPNLRGFSHVNPVFRCNRFEPGDEPFRRHFDTPYHDAARRQISHYTLLIYLTEGTGAPALQIEDLKIDSIEARQCFVFHQAYEHAGAAFTDGRKVFLRTELVFENQDVTHDPRIAALFAKACYLTGESIRDAELARDADRAYNAVATAHWTGVLPPSTDPVLRKSFRGNEWLANGYDFWFPRRLPLADCAALVLLDYFNCLVGGVPFRSLVSVTTVRDLDPEVVVPTLSSPTPLAVLDKDALFPPAEALGPCCPGHASLSWIATRSPEVVDLYTRAQVFARARVDPAPITILGRDVYLDSSRFQISGNQIHVLSRERLAPVNFAACWNCHSSPPNFVGVDFEVGVLHPLVPPILWEATANTHHLMFDFFRNGWAVSHDRYDVAIPRIRNLDFQTVDETETPWLEASGNCHLDPKRPEVAMPFWSRVNSALIRELYADHPSR